MVTLMNTLRGGINNQGLMSHDTELYIVQEPRWVQIFYTAVDMQRKVL